MKYYLIKADMHQIFNVEGCHRVDNFVNIKDVVELTKEELAQILNCDKYQNVVLTTYPPQYLVNSWVDKIRKVLDD